MPASPISVLLVDDSPVALTILQRILSNSTEVEVVGVASNGIEALQLIPQVQPKIICTDLHMPHMSGLELTRRIMAECPRPILVVSTSVDQNEDAETVFQLLQSGALDVFPKPNVATIAEYEQIKQDLITRIKILSGVTVFTQHQNKPSRSTPLTASPLPTPYSRSTSLTASPCSSPLPFDSAHGKPTPHSRSTPLTASSLPTPSSPFHPHIITIGASTGGPQALHTILRSLPANFPAPIVCVQHISEGFLDGLVKWLSLECALRVAIAQPKELPQAGTVYFSPDHCHLCFDPQGRFMLSNDLPVCGHRPSVDVLFKAIATHYKRSALAILLTGMGRDGADGLMAIAQAGGVTIAQDEQSCVVFGMPKEAITIGAAQHILPLREISSALLKRCSLGAFTTQ